MSDLRRLVAGAVALATFVACAPPSEPRPESPAAEDGAVSSADEDIVIRFGVVTRSEPRLTVQGSQPLVDYLTEATPYRVELRMGQSSEDVELDAGRQDLVTFLEERLVELTPLGVLSYCLADRRFGADVLVQTLDDDGEPVERAAFVTVPASDVRSIDDLDGAKVALGASHSMVSHVLGVYELDRAEVLAKTSHFDNDAAVVDAVLSGAFDAGVVAEPYVDDRVRVFHRSVAIPSRPIVVRDDLPESVKTTLRDALVGVEADPSWDRLFRNGFAAPNREDYASVRQVLNELGSRCAGTCHEPVRFGDAR